MHRLNEMFKAFSKRHCKVILQFRIHFRKCFENFIYAIHFRKCIVFVENTLGTVWQLFRNCSIVYLVLCNTFSKMYNTPFMRKTFSKRYRIVKCFNAFSRMHCQLFINWNPLSYQKFNTFPPKVCASISLQYILENVSSPFFTSQFSKYYILGKKNDFCVIHSRILLHQRPPPPLLRSISEGEVRGMYTHSKKAIRKSNTPPRRSTSEVSDTISTGAAVTNAREESAHKNKDWKKWVILPYQKEE